MVDVYENPASSGDWWPNSVKVVDVFTNWSPQAFALLHHRPWFHWVTLLCGMYHIQVHSCHDPIWPAPLPPSGSCPPLSFPMMSQDLPFWSSGAPQGTDHKQMTCFMYCDNNSLHIFGCAPLLSLGNRAASLLSWNTAKSPSPCYHWWVLQPSLVTCQIG
jgi:hypothetical protein